MSLIWWEKTVEYEFVLLMAREKRIFLAPLDGMHEIAGDAIFSSNKKWVLIEFKKDLLSIKTEKEKFINYEEAKEALLSDDGHHHIIFGQQCNKDSSRLELKSRTYFSELSHNLIDILSSGKIFSDFKDYVQQYIQFKKGPRSGGEKRFMIEKFSLIAGINANNIIVECLSLIEFQRQLKFEFKLEHEMDFSKGFEGPSF